MSERLRNSNASATPNTIFNESSSSATSGSYQINDLNVYRDGQPIRSYEVNPNGG